MCVGLTHCGLVTPYGDRDLGQLWLRQWLVAWRHQAITWTNVDLSSVMSLGIHLRELSLNDVKIPINKTRLKMASRSPRGQWVKTSSLMLMTLLMTIPPCSTWQLSARAPWAGLIAQCMPRHMIYDAFLRLPGAVRMLLSWNMPTDQRGWFTNHMMLLWPSYCKDFDKN